MAETIEGPGSGTRRGGARTIALEDLDADYQRKGVVLGSEDAKKAVYFGRGTIGPIGMAMALHRRLWVEDRSMTADTFGRALEAAIAQELGDSPLPGTLDSLHLRAWVQASRPVALPEPQHAPTVVRALQRLAREHRLSDQAVAALDGRWTRPSELLARLRDMQDASPYRTSRWLPIDKVFLSATASAQRYGPLANMDERHDALATLIGDAFVGKAGRDKIIFVEGERYSGKREAVYKMIQASLVPPNLIDVPGQGRLRLFARNVEDTPIEQIIVDVAELLGVEVPADVVPSQIDMLIGRIATKAREPGNAAAYVLAEVPAPGGLLTRLLGKERLQRLIDALFVGNNRLLLTGTDSRWLNRDKVICRVLRADAPTLSDIARAYDLKHDESRIPANVEVDGPFATLLTTLLDEKWPRSSASLERAHSVAVAAFRELVRSYRPEKDHLTLLDRRPDERPDLKILAEGVLQQLSDDADVLQTLELLALSEDGIQASAWCELLRPGSPQDAALGDFEQVSQKILDWLGYLSRRIDEAGPWPDEAPPDRDQLERVEPVLELIPPFQRLFERVFLEWDADFRTKCWKMARLAREKSRWKRLGSRSAYWGMPFETARDAQAIRRALIALDPEEIKKRLDPEQGIACSYSCLDRLVFAGSVHPSDRVNPVHAFRYLYFDLFRGDLDFEHRMSLQYHRDDLRLNLLLGFCNPGVPTYVEDDADEETLRARVARLLSAGASNRQILEEVPEVSEQQLTEWRKIHSARSSSVRRPELRTVLDTLAEPKSLGNWELLTGLLREPHDRAELLVSIAVSAKRVGAWTIVADAVSKAAEMVENEVVHLADVERVYRCEIDTMVLRCGSDMVGTLSEVQHRITVLLDALSTEQKLIEKRSAGEADGKCAIQRLWKACVKLQARTGEVLALTARDARGLQRAREAFEAAESLERKNTLGDWSGKGRSPLLGYGARRFLRLLCEMAEKKEYAHQKSKLLEHAEDLYNLNMRQTARFPAETSSLLLDMAWISRLKGRPDHAEALLRRLVDHPAAAAASISARVDMDASLARIALDLLESDTGRTLIDRTALARQALASIESVMRLATTGGLPLYLAFAELCAAKWLRLSDIGDRQELDSAPFDGRQADDLERSARVVFQRSECHLYIQWADMSRT